MGVDHNGRRDLSNIGAYRTHEDPMQIVSYKQQEPTVHFEAPPSNQVQREMTDFISWFNASSNLSPLLRAAIAHIHFETIHPFEDGNGRIGRAISEKALSQGIKAPTIIALAKEIERTRKHYYSALQLCSQSLDIQEWLEYFCTYVINAQAQTQSLIDFTIEKSKFYQAHESQLNERQSKVIKRLFDAGIDGFKGGLSAENYITITNTSRATTTRDLQNLTQIGALTKTGERKHTRYWLNINHPNAKQHCET